MWYCKKCASLQSATKKLEIFRLPPFLIIHLKRFQFTNGRWAKSQIPVTFPFDNLQPVPIKEQSSFTPVTATKSHHEKLTKATPSNTSDEIAPVIDDNKTDLEIKVMKPTENIIIEDHTSRNKVYDLYAMTTHYGYLGGGHYVSFAKSREDNNWYYYNDSSCKQTEEDRVAKEPAYLLFYKQQGELNIEKISGELHDFKDTDSDEELEETTDRTRIRCPLM